MFKSVLEDQPQPLRAVTPHVVALTNLLHDAQHSLEQICFHADGGRPIPTAFAVGQMQAIGKAIMQEARHIEKHIGA